jgi:hypothetical protein
MIYTSNDKHIVRGETSIKYLSCHVFANSEFYHQTFVSTELPQFSLLLPLLFIFYVSDITGTSVALLI